MKHYVLTRSAYGPTWSPEANASRLAITRAVTARLMARQAVDWTWIVALHPEDPLLEERKAVFAAAAPRFIPLMWTPDELKQAPWDREPKVNVPVNSLVAAAAYRAPWRSVMSEDGDRLIQTRLDDDDGLAIDALERYQRAAGKVNRRTVLLFPIGLRVNGDQFQPIRHYTNAMQSLVTLPGDDLCIYDYGHTHCGDAMLLGHSAGCRRVRDGLVRHGRGCMGSPVKYVDRTIGWLWVRHRDTISGWKMTSAKLTDSIRRVYPIDWGAVEAAA